MGERGCRVLKKYCGFCSGVSLPSRVAGDDKAASLVARRIGEKARLCEAIGLAASWLSACCELALPSHIAGDGGSASFVEKRGGEKTRLREAISLAGFSACCELAVALRGRSARDLRSPAKLQQSTHAPFPSGGSLRQIRTSSSC